MSRRSYFPKLPTDPPPLMVSCQRRVRFEEVDSIGMLWHGRYASYFEDGRIAFGDRFGLSYELFVAKRTMAPVAKMHFDFKAPLRFNETVTIETRLHWNEAMRFDFSYRILKADDTLAATGYTVQLLLTPEGTVLLASPDWVQDFREQWQNGHFEEGK